MKILTVKLRHFAVVYFIQVDDKDRFHITINQHLEVTSLSISTKNKTRHVLSH